MLFDDAAPLVDGQRDAIVADYLADETACVTQLLEAAAIPDDATTRITEHAGALVAAMRDHPAGGIDALLGEYDLSSGEGVALMCLAEALLRIPDSETADDLIRDKLAEADWARHLGDDSSLFVNAATWGLMLTGRLVQFEDAPVDNVGDFLGRLAARLGEPVVRRALQEGMRVLGHQFVMGDTIDKALARATTGDYARYRYSFDMLGEAALTTDNAERYFDAYRRAISSVAEHAGRQSDVFAAPGLSIKLSALHPRFEFAKQRRLREELVPRVAALARQAQHHNLGLAIDAEEAERLDPLLDVFEQVYARGDSGDWEGFGLAVQCYQKRALPVTDWLIDVARRHGRRIPVRLVKGAYWDAEVKRAQERGLDDYPVFTRKAHTDVAYQACARRLLACTDAVYPQFATHNARTAATVLELAAGATPFEFQRLHGMGDALFTQLLEAFPEVPCRVYAPVGRHEELLPYLVRRLLENGSNTSFVNRISDADKPIEAIVADPVATVRAEGPHRHPRIPLPADLFGEDRRNARGLNLQDARTLRALDDAMTKAAAQTWAAAPTVKSGAAAGTPEPITNPAARDDVVGQVITANVQTAAAAMAAAHAVTPDWMATSADERGAMLERAATLIENSHAELMMLIVREGGRCIPDAHAEIREAADFCRYYAAQARRAFGAGMDLPGPTGESNTLRLRGRGVFACISPWNFPLAIFAGQVAAALAAGNTVVAKPAEATPLTAAATVALLREAGIPEAVVQLLPGAGPTIGDALLRDPRLAGVAFTGSTETAHAINRALAQRPGPILPLIAETGGQNAMIVDSSALPEQVVVDVLASAFNSAGQRCSALRVLFVQKEIAPRILALLAGAMDELQIGDPARLATDVGPVISAEARNMLLRHCERMRATAYQVHAATLPTGTANGSFVAPIMFEIDRLDLLEREVFGPVLHVVRYSADALDTVIAAINATGYGLTLGIHSRIEGTQNYIAERVRAGNAYVNRNMIGAVVGVQPFGGEGLSGTGPKAGGPHYLHRFATERTLSINTAAVGGNAALLGIGGED
jgi:RHH-type proline utilization regulon transcriptional repressor/proline dehydrogenase/delta 1-pyrroline-5-carboxylate dehydrogenase